MKLGKKNAMETGTLWHMLVHAIAGVLVLVTTARVLEVQMENR